MEQIINLYLDKVLVYPDYVEIHLNTVPTNLLNPSQTKDEPALSGLHTFYVERMFGENRTRRKVKSEHNILVKLQRKQEKNTKSRRKGNKETRAQTMLDSSKTGGARATVLEHRRSSCCGTMSSSELPYKAKEPRRVPGLS